MKLWIFATLGALAFLVLLAFALRRVLNWLTERRLSAAQVELLQKHYDEVQNIYRQMRGWKHDFHNHIQNIKAYIALGNVQELNAYLGRLDADLTAVDTILRTGNIMLDAILNSKLSLAATRHIRIDASAQAPPDVPIADIDLCVIIGNLIDNATEACLRVPCDSERFLRVYIGSFKGQLYFSVSNSMAGKARRISGLFPTSKVGFHGFGLLRIERIVRKYGGYINQQSEEGVFATEILLPLTEDPEQEERTDKTA